MIPLKLMMGLTLIGAWVWFMGCIAPDTTTSMVRRQPTSLSDAAHEVTPGHARLFLEQVSEENGTSTYSLMLADYLVGRPAGHGMRFSLVEKHDGVFASAITEAELTPVLPTATPIRVIHVADRVAAESALPPTTRVPATVAVLSVLHAHEVQVTFWYRDVAGLVREGTTAITPQLNGYTPWTDHLRVLHLFWTVPADVGIIGVDAVTAALFVAALPVLIFVQ